MVEKAKRRWPWLLAGVAILTECCCLIGFILVSHSAGLPNGKTACVGVCVIAIGSILWIVSGNLGIKELGAFAFVIAFAYATFESLVASVWFRGLLKDVDPWSVRHISGFMRWSMFLTVVFFLFGICCKLARFLVKLMKRKVLSPGDSGSV